MDAIAIRRVEPGDFGPLSVVAAAAYAHAYAHLWRDPSRLAERLQRFTPQALRIWSEEPGLRLWVAAAPGCAPVGFLGLRLPEPDPVSRKRLAEVHRVYLLPNAAGGGVGRRLLAAAEACACAAGVTSLWLKSMEDAPARAAYARWGFHPVGRDRLDNDIAALSPMVVLRKEIAP